MTNVEHLGTVLADVAPDDPIDIGFRRERRGRLYDGEAAFMSGDDQKATAKQDGAIQRQAHDASTTPKDLKVKLEQQRLLVQWADGVRSEFSLNDLRRHCPCATCKTEREKKTDNPFQILKANPDDIRVTQAELVGNYAIRFTWSDGHATGIFDFRYLRSLEKK